MLGRLVLIDTDYQTVGTAVQDLLEVKLGTAQAGYIVGYKVMQSSSEGVTATEKVKLNLKRASGSFTSGSGGGTPTMVKGQTGDPAHGLATTERNNTTQAVIGTGALDVIDPDLFNVQAGGLVDVDYTPEQYRPIGPGEAAILSIDETLAASLSMRAVLKLLLTHG